MSKREFQQGDVILKPIDALPEGLSELKTTVLQLGEVTGHKHQFAVAPAGTVKVYADGSADVNPNAITPDENKFLVIEGGAQALSHEEHKTIDVPPGIYKVDIVREYDYDKEEMARVAD